MKIVIFSGYDDFDYAKRAIKLNVTEYILKPVNVEELTAILRRIQESLNEEIEQKRDVSLLRENYRRSMPILREQYLKDLVSHQMDGKTVNDRRSMRGSTRPTCSASRTVWSSSSSSTTWNWERFLGMPGWGRTRL